MKRKCNQWALEELENIFTAKGGLIDCHRHLDRQNTLNKGGYELIANNTTLQQKWEYIEQVNRSDLYVDTLKERMIKAVKDMMHQGIKACRTYIDIDTTSGLIGLNKALEVKKWAQNLGFTLQVAIYPVKGTETSEDESILKSGLKNVDAIGTLPSRVSDIDVQSTVRNNMNYYFSIAKMHRLPIDLQIDQANSPFEIESQILCEVARIFRDGGYDKSITAVHCISLGTQKLLYIKKIAKEFKELEINVVVCPGAALSMLEDRSTKGPIRNSIAPVKELIEEGVNVAIGTDNVSDIFMPFTNGCIREEIRELARAIRWQDNLSEFADIATVNGRKTLGISVEGMDL